MATKYKTKILRVDALFPLDGDSIAPGALVKEVEAGKPIGLPMRVIQVGGVDVLLNYVEKDG